MQNPLALLRARVTKPAVAVVAHDITPPYQRPGYKRPEKMTALDYLRPEAHFPLAWPLDIHGYDAVSQRNQGQTAFTLSGGFEGRAGVTSQWRIPSYEGEIFDKDGTYIVIVVPASDDAMVRDVLDFVRSRGE